MHKYKITEQGQSLENASKALIALHGRGSSPSNILELAHDICDETFYIVAPQATNNAWYPYSFLEEDKVNEPWLSSAVDTVTRLIEEISRYIPKKNIYVMGFSQGACLALETAARHAALYGGIIAFSGGLIGRTVNKDKYKGNFEGTKVFIGNSDKDPYIPLSRCEESKLLMESMGANVTLKIYPGMGHTVNDDEIALVRSMVSSS